MHSSPIERSAVQAMLNRAKQLALLQAALGSASGLRFAQGAINELHALLNSNGPAFAAERDASMGGYQPLAGFERAWAALPIHAKDHTLAEMRDFLVAQGVQVSAHLVADFNADAVQQLKNDVVTSVHSDDEHRAARADVGNSSGLHDASLASAPIVSQGGAA